MSAERVKADGKWITIEVERALYVSEGRSPVVCDRLPSPVTLLLKVAAGCPEDAFPHQGQPAGDRA